MGDPAEFRRVIDARFRNSPELFPAAFARGYQLARAIAGDGGEAG